MNTNFAQTFKMYMQYIVIIKTYYLQLNRIIVFFLKWIVQIYTLCKISLTISYVSHLFVLIFVQYQTISFAMTRKGSKANANTNIQTPSFK